MSELDRVAAQQISLKSEFARKITHLGALALPASYYWLDLSKQEMLIIMISAFILVLLADISRLRNWIFWRKFANKIWAHMVREHENKGGFTGATYILLSIVLTVALFSKPVAVAAMAFIMVGDTFAALVGRRFGRHKIFKTKSLEGSLACLTGTVIVALFTPDLLLTVGLTGALAAAVVEALPLKIDDNLTVPLLSGATMAILLKFI